MSDTRKPKPDWLDDPDAPPSEEEKIASARLRDALDDPKVPNADAELARALALADEPRPLAEEEHRAIVDRALATAKPRGQVIRVTFGVVTALALAAAAVLVLGKLDMASAPRVADMSARVPAQAPALAQARSTQELFDEPF